MLQVRVMYMNHNKPTLPPLGAQMVLEGAPDELLGETITLSCGDGAAQGAITVPLYALTALMGKIMSALEKQQSGIILPPPGIIRPN